MNIKVLFICFIVTASLDPGLDVALSNGFINQMRDYVLPIVNKQIDNIDIPDQSGKAGPVTYSLTQIHFHLNPVSSSQISINLVDGKPEIDMAVSGAGGNGHLVAHYKISFISDHVDVDVNFRNIGVTAPIFMGVDGDGRPTVNVQAQAHMRSSDIDVHFSGSISAVVLQALEPIIQSLFFNNIVDAINKGLPSWVSDPINALLKTLPLDQQIKDSIYVTYALPSAPTNFNGYITVGMAGYFYINGQKNPPPYSPPSIPKYDPGNQKAVQFFLSDYILQTAIDVGFKLGLYEGGFSFDLFEFEIDTNCSCSIAPTILFNQEITVTASGGCDISAKNTTSGEVMTFGFSSDFDLHINEDIKNDIVYFLIDDKDIGFKNMQWKNPLSFNITWFQDNIDTVLVDVADYANKYIGAQGIPLPKFPQVDFVDLEQGIFNNYIEIYSDLVFHG